jgi:hypothetical protein
VDGELEKTYHGLQLFLCDDLNDEVCKVEAGQRTLKPTLTAADR